jgi:phosphoribosylamine-glycine ligase
MPLCHFSGKNIWILKPTGLNRGKGIHVVDKVVDVKRIIEQTCYEHYKDKPAKSDPQSVYNASKAKL